MVEAVKETAAIGVSGPHGGPCSLIVYVVLTDSGAEVDTMALMAAMQKMIKLKLNPLFGIKDVVITESLPRTASNKVMRRLLRDEYIQKETLVAAK